MTPATVEDAYSMLLDAVAIDDPVIFCEHKFLYYHLKADKLPTEAMPTGKARIARAGRDLTIVAYSAMVHEALAVAEELSGEGTEIEVVDLRSVKPLDTDTVMASVARTGRLLCVGEAWPWGGVTAEVIARVATEGFGLLDAPPQRLNAKDTPVPYHPNLWSVHRPTAGASPQPPAICCGSDRFKDMARIPIIMPQLGESIAEATVVNLLVQVGDQVKADQDVVEVETNKATMNVTSPCPGQVHEWLVKLNESYPVGDVLGYLEVNQEDAERLGLETPVPRPDKENGVPKASDNRVEQKPA